MVFLASENHAVPRTEGWRVERKEAGNLRTWSGSLNFEDLCNRCSFHPLPKHPRTCYSL